jgi:hypothetical protein
MRNTWLVLILLTSSCGSAMAQSPGDLDTGFSIALAPAPSGDGIVAHLETSTMYPCAGYTILSMVTWEKDTISIHINGMMQPSPCIPSGDIATGTAYLGAPGPGNYFLRILYRGEVDIHKVAFVPGEATTKPVRDHFSHIRGY